MIISIGIQCTVSSFKNNISKTHTLPFDWMLSNPKFVYEMLVLLLRDNIDIEDLVKNYFFKCEDKCIFKCVEKYYTSCNGNALLNKKYDVIFPHDVHNTDTINKYIRRFERLKDLILNSPEDLIFVYCSQSSLENGNFTIDDHEVVKDVYFYLSQIYTLIKEYRQRFKMIVFDSIQTEDPSTLNENIMLTKLNKCNIWPELVSQMNSYIHLFI